MNKRIAFFIPDGVGIRNYLFSDLVKKIFADGSELILITSISQKAIEEVERLHNYRFSVVSVPPYKEGFWEKFVRELDNIARLRLFARKLDNPTLIPLAWRKLNKYHGLIYWFYYVIRLASYTVVSYWQIQMLNKLYLTLVRRSKDTKGFQEMLDNLKVDAVLCTHQRAILASPLFEAAKKVGVEAFTVVYSWDNIPKARMAFRADKYLVWSQHMKNEILFFYPEIDPERVMVTGTPQFEFYRRDDLIRSREAFCQEYGFDVNRPIVCYSGGDRLTSPYDQDYLNDLAVALKELPRKEQPQILFRRCPVDWSERFDTVLEKHKDVIKVVDPLWAFEKEGEKWALTYPLFSDVKLLANVARHCDLVYNVGSTMAHDYSMFDKPACYINYNPQNAINGYSIEKVYQYQHFRSMPSRDAVVWVNSKSEISELVMRAIKNPEMVAPERKAWLEKIILQPVTDASGNIAKILLNEKPQ
jgi:hypothetical protein